MQGGKNRKNFAKNNIQVYITKIKSFPGTRYGDVSSSARFLYKQLKKRTKRRAYVRSAYFKKEKIFFDYFWEHLKQKREKDKVRRLKIFPCAIDLLENSKVKPNSIDNPNKKGEYLHKFIGITKDRQIFYVQVKENKKTGTKYLMSCFPEK